MVRLLALAPFFAGRPMLALFLITADWAMGSLTLDGARRPPTHSVLPLALTAALALAELVGKRVFRSIRSITPGARPFLRASELVIAVIASVVGAAFVAGAPERAMSQLPITTLSAVAALTFALAWMRGSIVDAASAANVADLPIDRHVTFVDLAVNAFGVFVALWFPIAGVAFAGACTLIGLGVYLTLKDVERGAWMPCERCAGSVHACALECPACGAARPAARTFGLFGARGSLVGDSARKVSAHRRALLRARRCPSCAEVLEGGGAQSRCSTCRLVPLAEAPELRAFVRSIDRRVASILPTAAAAGVVPIFGWPLAMLVFRLSGSDALAAWAEWTGRAGSHLLRRTVFTGAALLQFLPFVGAVVNPLAILAMHASHRASLLASARTAQNGRTTDSLEVAS